MRIKSFKDIFGHDLTIKELYDGFFEDTATGSIKAFEGKLEVHPPYQRNFVYSLDKQKAVVDTVLSGCPLSVMYWAENDNGTYELLDGQQRTLSICKYRKDSFSADVNTAGNTNPKTFSSCSKTLQEDFDNYTLLVFICTGTEDEKMAWFEKINTAGVPLVKQEMRNAIYNGPWVTDAKRYFSNPKGKGYNEEGLITNGHIYGDYLDVIRGTKETAGKDENVGTEKNKSLERQKLLEIVLAWAVDEYNRRLGRNITIEEYMDMYRNAADAKNLWRYYEDVMEWVKKTLPTYRAAMKGVEWGILYNKYHTTVPSNADGLANQVFDNLVDEISNPKGVYEAVLANNTKFIHARTFQEKDKRWAFNKQNGICPICHKAFTYEQMQGDHIKPWSKGGITERDNLQMICVDCNSKKSAYDATYSPWDGKIYVKFDKDKGDNGLHE